MINWHIGIGVIILLVGAAIKPLASAARGRTNNYDTFFITYSKFSKVAKAVAKVESNFNPNALGDNGKSYGLMQIQVPTAKGYGFTGAPYQLFNPETNIKYASRFLDDMILTYGLETGIMAYNIGETKIRRGITNPIYLHKVQSTLNTF